MNRMPMETTENNLSKIILETWTHLSATVAPNLTAKKALERTQGLQWWCVYSKRNNKYGIAFDVSNDILQQKFQTYRFLQIEVYPERDHSLLAIFLNDDDFKPEFAVLSSHLICAVSESRTDISRIHKVVNELKRWENLFSRLKDDGMPIPRQRGLLGELYLLNELLQGLSMSKEKVIGFWDGPDAAAQDFQGNNWAIEVKASAKSRPRCVHINGERQLDNSLFDYLFLYYSLVDASGNNGITLPELVKRIREILAGNIQAEQDFNTKLLMYGYRDEDSDKYSTHYVIREKVFYLVDDDFPKLIESSLVNGISNIEYNLDLDVCDSWLTPLNKVLTVIENS